MNPYMAFSMEARKRIVAENPSMKADIGGVAKMVGKEWQALSEAEKAKYAKKGKTMKAKTKKAKKAKTEKKGTVVATVKKMIKKGTRKLSGYMKFANKVRPAIMAESEKMRKDVTAVAREIGKRWRALTESQKKSHA